jgi:hypothetical protein
MIVHLVMYTENITFSDTHKSVRKFELKSKSLNATEDYSTVQVTEMSVSKPKRSVDRSISQTVLKGISFLRTFRTFRTGKLSYQGQATKYYHR